MKDDPLFIVARFLLSWVVLWKERKHLFWIKEREDGAELVKVNLSEDSPVIFWAREFPLHSIWVEKEKPLWRETNLRKTFWRR